jgi:hypothetical protein
MRCTVSDRRESIRTFLKIARITSVLLVAVFSDLLLNQLLNAFAARFDADRHVLTARPGFSAPYPDTGTQDPESHLHVVAFTKRQDQQYAQRHAAKGTPPPS